MLTISAADGHYPPIADSRPSNQQNTHWQTAHRVFEEFTAEEEEEEENFWRREEEEAAARRFIEERFVVLNNGGILMRSLYPAAAAGSIPKMNMVYLFTAGSFPHLCFRCPPSGGGLWCNVRCDAFEQRHLAALMPVLYCAAKKIS